MTYAIMLAGGIGSRFWPISSNAQPKQFLGIHSAKPMICETLERITPLINKERVFIAAGRNNIGKLNHCLKPYEFRQGNIFLEPLPKNTLPPIAYLANRIKKTDKDAVIVVLPCDHVIRKDKNFLACIKSGADIARLGFIVTMGIKPLRPETGYGYIMAGKKIKGKKLFYKAAKFIEKPPLATAKRLIKNPKYFWNSGIFIFKAGVFLDELMKLDRGQFNLITGLKEGGRFDASWKKIKAVSVDYSVMEKSKKLVVMPAEYGWVDLGSWQAVEEVTKKDASGNILKGRCFDLGSKNTTVWSESRIIGTIGLEDMVVVETKEAVLVCKKNKCQDIKKLFFKIKTTLK